MNRKYLKNKKLLWSQAEITSDTKSSLGAAVSTEGLGKEETHRISVSSHKSLTKLQILDQWLNMGSKPKKVSEKKLPKKTSGKAVKPENKSLVKATKPSHPQEAAAPAEIKKHFASCDLLSN